MYIVCPAYHSVRVPSEASLQLSRILFSHDSDHPGLFSCPSCVNCVATIGSLAEPSWDPSFICFVSVPKRVEERTLQGSFAYPYLSPPTLPFSVIVDRRRHSLFPKWMRPYHAFAPSTLHTHPLQPTGTPQTLQTHGHAPINHTDDGLNGSPDEVELLVFVPYVEKRTTARTVTHQSHIRSSNPVGWLTSLADEPWFP